MKKKYVFLLWAILLLLTAPAYAQLNIDKKLQNKINQRFDQGVDKTLDNALEALTKKTTVNAENGDAEEGEEEI